MPLACGEGNVLLMVTAAGMALYALHAHVDVNRFLSQRNTTKTADCEAIPYNIFTSALRTAKFFAPSLHIQNNSIIFVLRSRTLDRPQAETVIQKADVHNNYLLWFGSYKDNGLSAFSIHFFQKRLR
jgi:hypothetical protein